MKKNMDEINLNVDAGTKWADGLGTAVIILALCLGIGGCQYLSNAGVAKRINAVTAQMKVMQANIPTNDVQRIK